MESGTAPTTGIAGFPAWRRSDVVAIAAWVGLIAATVIWGLALLDSGAVLGLRAPPLFGFWDVRIGAATAVPIGAAAAVILAGPRLAFRLPFGRLCAIAVLAAGAWAVALALTTGADGLTDPVTNPNEYLASLRFITSPGDFLSHFTDRIDLYSTHVRGHPPGMVLLLYGLDRVGLGGAAPAAAVIIAVGSSAAAAALLALRSLAGEQAARRAAPFLVLTPAAVWIATSADALFMGVSSWAVAMIVIAIGSRGRRSDLLAVGGGAIFGVSLFLSYGLVLLGTVPLAVAIAARRVRPLVLAAVGALAVVAAVTALGYWWLDGYNATREQYAAGIARTRPYWFFVFCNLAAFALAAGPAVAIALGRLRDHRIWLLVGGGLAAVALADISGLSKAEVERIWLPFLPWVLLATAAIRGDVLRRNLLVAQAACAIAIQTFVLTGW